MEKRELASLIVKKETKDSVVVSVRVRQKTVDKLKAKGMDIPATVKAVLERLAD
jgi:post-segregation antitoxin (ccd killing protein)